MTDKHSELPPEDLMRTLGGTEGKDLGAVAYVVAKISKLINSVGALIEVTDETNLAAAAASQEMRDISTRIASKFNFVMGLVIVGAGLQLAFTAWIWTVSAELRNSHNAVITELKSDNARLTYENKVNRRIMRGQAVLLARIADSMSFALEEDEARRVRHMAAAVEVIAIEEQQRLEPSPEGKVALRNAKVRKQSMDAHASPFPF